MTAEEAAAARAALKGAAGATGAEDEQLFVLLKRDHEEIIGLFNSIERCGKGEMEALLKLFTSMEEEFRKHLEAEERFFYTALEQHEAARELVLESYEVHHLAKISIGAFNALAMDDERWRAKVRVLRRLAELHIEVEENVLFPVAAQVLGREQMRNIAEQFKGLKSDAIPRSAGVDAPR